MCKLVVLIFLCKLPLVLRYFDKKLMRSTRCEKVSANGFDAFDSPKSGLIATYDGEFTFDLWAVQLIQFRRFVDAKLSLEHLPQVPRYVVQRSMHRRL